ncbi:uncharacterized protein [Diabrotica undecimpunctata]|uniref:uncharacterized protein n=1 Tax=Diabrotica undecimpunctata TaxID=50387 RepID=UPI003B63605B
MLTSRTKVAPLKNPLTIPRLELCAMLLGAELACKLVKIFKNRIQLSSVHLWTDSEIALHWVIGSPTRWELFVANRVKRIQDLSKDFYWHHVASKDNAADIASRGATPGTLESTKAWLCGPEFLSTHDIDYSRHSINLDFTNVIGLKDYRVVFHSTQDLTFWEDIFKLYSTFSRLRRVLAFVLRFVNNVRKRDPIQKGPLYVAELQQAELLIVRHVQIISFPRIIESLKSGKGSQDKQLAALNLFLDESDNCLKVGGRLRNANIPLTQKNPILLPSKNQVVSMMLYEKHVQLGHLGPQGTLSNFRLRYWPLNSLRDVKRVFHHCVTCFRFRAVGSSQLMADLPKDRVVQPIRPFQNVSVDYGGYFLIKASRLRKAKLLKVYVAIFVCMVTKAVHIEVVSSLSTEDFILALKRFISRRGNPTTLYSDNGSNFWGAKNLLFELYEFFKDNENSQELHDFCSKNSIQFYFIPPNSPHHGGLHESAIRSCKYHLHLLVGNANLTFEEFYTVISQIEAIMNSRPITPLSSDPNDLECLTPAHFLIGTSMTAHPERVVISLPENKLSLYQRLSRIQQLFWKRWHVDYLNQLQKLPKWVEEKANLEPGMVVLVKGDNTHPLQWPIARIVDTFPGPDGRVRSVRIKTSAGTYVRPIVKICLLPFNDRELESQPGQ